jgi:hypothetical protein
MLGLIVIEMRPILIFTGLLLYNYLAWTQYDGLTMFCRAEPHQHWRRIIKVIERGCIENRLKA